jgi:ABC-type transporter Mla subunit MlaD
MLSGGQVAGLIVAMFWAILVCFLALVLLRLARLLKEATAMVADLGEQAGPLLDDMAGTVTRAGEQLDRVDLITKSVGSVTQNAAAVTTTVTSVVGGPLVKAAAFSYGVRKVIGDRGSRNQDGKR